jgi:hypothetical protein
MFPDSYLNLVHANDGKYVGQRDGVLSVSVERVRLDELDCYKLRYLKENGEYHVWIAPDRDFNVIKIETAFEEQREVLRSKLQQVDGSRWFPSEVQYEAVSDGQLQREEKLSIEVVQFNEPIKDSTFDFIGMDIPIGHPISDHIAQRSLVMGAEGPIEKRQ